MLVETPLSHDSPVTIGLGWVIGVGIATAWAALLAHVHRTFVRKDVLAETLGRRDAQIEALTRQIETAKRDIQREIRAARGLHDDHE